MLWIHYWYDALTTAFFPLTLATVCLCCNVKDAICLKTVLFLEQILGNHTEFQRVANLLQDTVDFDIDVNASVFETNIRGNEDLVGSIMTAKMFYIAYFRIITLL